MTKRKNIFGWLDGWLVAGVLACVLIGFFVIASSTLTLGQSRYLIVQGAAFVIGVIAILLICKIDYDYIGQLAPFIFGFNIILLVIVLFVGEGRDEVGTQGWIRFGFVGIQPAELVKIGFIITFAKHLEMVGDDIDRPKNVLLLLLHAGIITGLILLQPDFGTAIVFVFMCVMMLFVAGISWKYIAAAFGTVAVGAVPVWMFLLKDFQKNRILSFFNPELDPMGSGYHVLQSKIAIGSGKTMGQGLFHGVQTQLGYLPEKQTDFIYAVIGEELGLWGALLVLTLCVVVVVRCFVISGKSRDFFGQMLCVGVGSMFMFHVIENIGMCIGIMPVTGISLPFISYGGSNMIASLLGIALVLNVNMRKKPLNFYG